MSAAKNLPTIQQAMDQAQELCRTADDLTQLIVDWFNAHEVGHTFHLGEFTRDILNQHLCSPCSPYRIMALLRTKNIINYKVIDRSQSLYQTTPLGEDNGVNVVSMDDFFEGA